MKRRVGRQPAQASPPGRQLGQRFDDALRRAMRLEAEVRREREQDVRRHRSLTAPLTRHGEIIELRHGRIVKRGYLTEEEIRNPPVTRQPGVGPSDQGPSPSRHSPPAGNAPEVETSSPQLTPGPAAPNASMVHAHMPVPPAADEPRNAVSEAAPPALTQGSGQQDGSR